MKTQNQTNHNRIPEIDALRGIAILLMIGYHIIFDLYFFDLANFEFILSPLWEIFRDMIAGLFIILVGISLHLSHTTQVQTHPTRQICHDTMKRGIQILFWGMLISCITYLFIDPIHYVRFGVLHLIGSSLIIALPFLFFKKATLPAGIIIIVLGIIFNQLTCSPILIPLACTPGDFSSIDYFPLMPWAGLVLVGLWLGRKLFWQPIETYLPQQGQTSSLPITTLTAFGRHSLIIYLTHQPIILGILSVYRILNK